MLMSIRWGAVLLGLGIGVLALAAGAILLWLVLSMLAVEGAATAATTFGALLGFGVAGWTSGRRAPYSSWYHGAVAGLGTAMVVVVTSILGGSPAPIPQVLLLAALAIVLGGSGGFWAGRGASRGGAPGVGG